METIPPIPAAEPQPLPTSLWSRLLNVFAAPGEVFEEVKTSKPSTGNWLVPALILMLAGMVSSVVIFSQPDIVQQIHEQQQKAFDKQISAGKMTQAQADQATAVAEKFSGPTMLMIFGCVGAVMTSFLSLVWAAFVLWLITRFYLKVPLGYGKMLEVAGLAFMIMALAVVVKTLLIVLTGNLYAALSPVLFVKHFDPRSPLHNLLTLLDVMTIWLLAVRSIGLAKLTGASFGKTATAVFVVWLVCSGLMIGFSLAMQAIFAK
jgi:hypothetical protein